jgi:hypothetical protein
VSAVIRDPHAYRLVRAASLRDLPGGAARGDYCGKPILDVSLLGRDPTVQGRVHRSEVALDDIPYIVRGSGGERQIDTACFARAGFRGMKEGRMTGGQTTDMKLLRRGLYLEYATLGWNVVGVVIVVAAAVAARSVALAGFGLDSLIEIFASVIVVWQLAGVNQHRERRALRLIGGAFFALAVYILGQEAFTFISGIRLTTSVGGIVWLAATLIAMLLLAQGKRITGRQLSNPVLATEAHVTLIDAYLAAAVLVGLILNAVAGWWWADPLAGLVIVYYGVKEGWTAWHGEE